MTNDILSKKVAMQQKQVIEVLVHSTTTKTVMKLHYISTLTLLIAHGRKSEFTSAQQHLRKVNENGNS
jgi:hypothetical protein